MRRRFLFEKPRDDAHPRVLVAARRNLCLRLTSGQSAGVSSSEQEIPRHLARYLGPPARAAVTGTKESGLPMRSPALRRSATTRSVLVRERTVFDPTFISEKTNKHCRCTSIGESCCGCWTVSDEPQRRAVVLLARGAMKVVLLGRQRASQTSLTSGQARRGSFSTHHLSTPFSFWKGCIVCYTYCQAVTSVTLGFGVR